jgi:hypothetical protein
VGLQQAPPARYYYYISKEHRAKEKLMAKKELPVVGSIVKLPAHKDGSFERHGEDTLWEVTMIQLGVAAALRLVDGTDTCGAVLKSLILVKK